MWLKICAKSNINPAAIWLPPPAKTVDVEVESKVEKLEVVCQRSENLKHDPTEEEK